MPPRQRRSEKPSYKYIHQLPYEVFHKLGILLDYNNDWRILGGEYMKFNLYELERIGTAFLSRDSPTERMLYLWSKKNPKVSELFWFLAEMKHFQAMRELMPYIDEKYHRFIEEGVSGKISDTTSVYVKPRTEKVGSGSNQSDERLTQNCAVVSPIVASPPVVSSPVASPPLVSPPLASPPLASPPLAPPPVASPPLASPPLASPPLASPPLASPPLASPPLASPPVASLPAASPTGANPNNRRAAEKPDSIDYSEIGSGLLFIEFKELTESTNNWDKSKIIGQGGFGIVFFGTVKQTPMAIKRLKRQKGNEMACDALKNQLRDFFKELKYLNSNRHVNILPLFGFSHEDDTYCLVSDYMSNGSLLDRLQCRDGTLPLSPQVRCYIARGTARGLQFLHDREKPLVHGDIKSANILLDGSFEPKIGDFGLSREGPTANYSYLQVSQAHGTTPYLPHEFLRGKKLSTKVDTYGFGVVLFEIITGLRAYDKRRSEPFLKDYVLKVAEERNSTAVIDPTIGFGYTSFFASSFFTLAEKCVAYRAKARPTMMEVCRTLEHLNSYMENLNIDSPQLPQWQSSAASLARPVQTRQLGYQQPIDNQRTPSPSYPVVAAPPLQRVLEEPDDIKCPVEVDGTSEVPFQTPATQSNPSHRSSNYVPLINSSTASKSAETVEDNMSKPLLSMSSDNLPFVSKLQD